MTDETLQAAEEAEHLDDELDSDSAPEESELPEEGEEAPDETEQATEGEEEQEQPDWYVKAINRQHFKFREEERKRQELENELQKLREKHPEAGRPEVPPPPDPFDEDYEQKVAARDKAIQAQIQYDTRQNLMAEVQRRQQQEQAQKQQSELQARVQSYSQRAEQAGIDAQDLAVAGAAVASYGINDNLAQYILNDEKGPLITMHLSRHPEVLEQIQSLDPVSAAVHIATQVVPQVSAAPDKTKAPKPPETLGGGGAPPVEEGPEGATYE